MKFQNSVDQTKGYFYEELQTQREIIQRKKMIKRDDNRGKEIGKGEQNVKRNREY